MKLLLISSIFILAICHPVLATWTNIDLAEANTDKEIQWSLNFGVRDVIQKGIKLGQLPNTKLEVSQIIRVATSLELGVNYKFDVELRDRKGNKYTIIFVVNYRSWDEVISVTSYSFKPLPDGTENPTFKKIYDPELVTGDPYVEGLIAFGLQYIANNPVPNSPDASYRLKNILVFQHTRGNPFRIWTLLEVESETGPDITFEIEFFDDPWLEQVRINYFLVYKVLYADERNLQKVHLQLPRSFTPEEYEANIFGIQEHFKFGLETAIAIGVKNRILPTSQYTLLTLWQASMDRVKGNNYFRFSAVILIEGFGALVVVPIVKNSNDLFSHVVSLLPPLDER